MIFNLFKKPPSSFLGVDIGTTGIRIVQLGLREKIIELENYASIETKDYLEILGNGGNLNNIRMSDDKIAKDLKSIIKKAGITSEDIIMSIPISSAFSSVITLPDIPRDELAKAVQFEARQYVPISLSEVVFDWSVIGKEIENDRHKGLKQADKIKALLVAIPKETTAKYVNIARLLNLNLSALETESFSLARSLVGKKDGVLTIVDIGNKTTSATVVENGFVIGSHSILGTGGEEMTRIISHGFNVDHNRAEKLKIDNRFNANKDSQKKICEMILPIAGIIVSEIKKINEACFRINKKKIQKIIFTGGAANFSGLVEYFSKELALPAEIGNPWSSIAHDEALNEKLKDNAPFFGIAVGLALRGFEK